MRFYQRRRSFNHGRPKNQAEVQSHYADIARKGQQAGCGCLSSGESSNVIELVDYGNPARGYVKEADLDWAADYPRQYAGYSLAKPF